MSTLSGHQMDTPTRIRVLQDWRASTPRFGLSRRSIRFRILAPPVDTNPKEWICSACKDVLAKVGEHFGENDLVGFTFEIVDRRNAWLPFKQAKQILIQDLWDLMDLIWQSNESALLSDQLHILATSSAPPTGAARDRKYNTHTEEARMRRGIVPINNKDRYCLPRAIVVSLARLAAGGNIRDPTYVRVRRNRTNLQTKEALKLIEAARVSVPDQGCGIEQLRQFQEHLKDYNITVYRAGSKGRDIVFRGNEAAKKNIDLLLQDNHYSVISSLTAAFGCTYFCRPCSVPYEKPNSHRCTKFCPSCRNTTKCPTSEALTHCEDCRRNFRGLVCFNRHKESGICGNLKKCHECLRVFIGDNHVCGYKICKICQRAVPRDHLCYMQVNRSMPKTEGVLFTFYDLECSQIPREKEGSCTEHVFVPNLCIYQKVCDKCSNMPASECAPCKVCGMVTITGDRVINRFMEDLLTLRKNFSKVVVLAHGGSIFDHQNLLNYIMTETSITPKLILRGTKILRMEFGNVVCIDSMNYFSMALSKLPEALDLDKSVFQKGYFPHLFNTPENQHYVGSFPEVDFYEPDFMKPKERHIFLDWYNENKNKEFNFQEEIIKYCKMDVVILAQACLKFRKMLIDECNVCPFTEACTIASTCMKVFKRNFLKPDTIGIVPRNGYRLSDNQSAVAIEWLVYMEHTRNTEIQHAAKGPEALVKGVKVDGYAPETNEVFEFHGCYFHGCPDCFPDQDNMVLKYQNTKAKTDRLREFGYTVTEIWECEFNHIRREALDIIGNHPLLLRTPLNPRDAFYGGRTGNVKTYYACKPGETIKYLDVNSLYPWVCKYGAFPVHHPRVIVGGDGLPSHGLVKCRVLPPQNLFHPVLPTKINNKLMFVLCRTCGEQLNQGECSHADDERALTGTWVVLEVKKALDMGYSLLEVFESWVYDVVQRSRTEKGLFGEMMDAFLKIKQEASGWPRENMVKEEKEEYIKDFLEKEGVALEAEKIQKNPGRRSLGKSMITNFWGKLGERSNLTQTKVIHNPNEYYKLAFDSPNVIINNVLTINDSTIVVNWENRSETVEDQPSANVVIAAFVTAQARLKLYSYLEMLGERVLYYDTDSAIFISKPGLPEPPTGNFLGDLSDELAVYGEGSFISEFVSGGPKNYGFKVVTPSGENHTVCKVKGVKLSYSTSEKINFDSIKEMVTSEDPEPVFIMSKNFRRTKMHEVIIRKEQKMYRLNSLKRKFERYDSVPYGYKKKRTEDS